MKTTLHNHLQLMKELEVELPLVLFLNITGIKGCKLMVDRGEEGDTLREGHLKFNEIMIHQFVLSLIHHF